jgi:hypothetical protein
MRAAILVSEPFEARSRLKDLGLDESIVQQVTQRILTARNQATENHPPTAAGLFGWLEGVAAFNELLTLPPYKWHRENINNLTLTVNESNTVGIIVATGDEATGRTDMDREPCTNCKKGPKTKSAVNTNLRQWTLFPDNIKAEDLIRASKGRTTWLFLWHYDEINEVLRCELSQPVAMDKTDHVKRWSVRIICKSISPDGPTSNVSPNMEPSPEIDIKVKKRA